MFRSSATSSAGVSEAGGLGPQAADAEPAEVPSGLGVAEGATGLEAAGAGWANDGGAAEDGGLPPEPAVLPVGEYLAEVSRPGHRTAFAAFSVTADEEAVVEVRLRRESAALRLRTSPAGAVVLVDGYERGSTRGVAEADFLVQGTTPWREREAFSAETWIDDLDPGPWRVEVRKDGYRAVTLQVEGRGLGDEALPPIVLEPEGSIVGLRGLPEDAEVLVNGRSQTPERLNWTPEIIVPPGAHTITVHRGIHGYFETSVTVEDGARAEVDVELRPALAFLGIFGADEAARRAVTSSIGVLRDETGYMVLDRTAAGAGLLDELGVDPTELRSNAATARLELDWKTIRRQLQERMPAALHLAAVLDDDLVAETVDLWWWTPAPGPARPDVRTLPIESARLKAGPLWRLLAALDPEPANRVRHVGAVVIESLAGDVLTVAAVEPGSPAAAAGMRPGMEILSVGGEEGAALHLSAALADVSPGGSMELEVLAEQGTAAVTLSPEWSWMPLNPFDPDLLLAAAASRRLRELDGGGDVPSWLVQLDLAMLLLGTGEAAEAARRLAAIDVSGLEETHADLVRYTLGVALASLAEAGAEEFRERAGTVFETLASSNRAGLLARRARLRADALRQ